jgi:hypothetical protein
MPFQVVLNKPSPEHKVEDAEFEPNEVYAIDIVVSTGGFELCLQAAVFGSIIIWRDHQATLILQLHTGQAS